MGKPAVLLINLQAGNNLCDTLNEILISSFKVETREIIDSQTVAAVPRIHYDLVFVTVPRNSKPDDVVRIVRQTVAEVSFVVVVEEAEPSEMFHFLQLGAADYITAPLRAVNILPRAWSLAERHKQPHNVVHALKEKLGLQQLVGNSPSFVRVLQKIPLVARCDAVILISGETGTGKELYARAIHHLSLRSDKPFIPVNCGAIPADLVENELFGHERGAFTGADSSERGLFEEAEGGTIFLDEVDCLPLLAQSKLLRFLQEKEYRPLGATTMRKADVRVLAASNVDFGEAMATGKLRKDLYYRLNVIRFVLPPLRERRDDIPLLVQHFLAKYANEFGKDVPAISASTMDRLLLYDWPGNVRELEHIIERAVLLSENGQVSDNNMDLPDTGEVNYELTFNVAKASVIEQFERAYIQRLLATHKGNITHAAQAAHKNRRAFWQLIRKHHIEVRNFRLGTS